MRMRPTATAIDRHRFPIEPWRLVERVPSTGDLGVTETLFAIGNGYLGMRANPSEGRDAHTHGTYVNGFHETWPIQHAEDAFAFARTGQTIVNVPDAKLLKLYVDDEPLLVNDADLEHYERALDFRTGISYRDLIWRTPAGKRVRVRSERLVSLAHRHLAIMHLEVTVIDEGAPIVISSQLLNRQDGQDEYHVADAALGEGPDPRRSRLFDTRVLVPELHEIRDADNGLGGMPILGYRCSESAMTLACGYVHRLDLDASFDVRTDIDEDRSNTVFSIDAQPGQTIRLNKFVTYHTSRGVPAEELADRCARTLGRAAQAGLPAVQTQQKVWLDGFWGHSDIEIDGDASDQQAVRWNLFQLAQATARTDEHGVAAKGVTASGYDGHYFWDTEVYVIPFLAYTDPEAARKLLRFRYNMLAHARARARELNQLGALYPWRTINGEEASAYYAAGTAQYHINADVAYALERYIIATDDTDLLAHEGAEVLVEVARLYEDLGFYATNGEERFHIHGVTGPDEYTTVVNDNMYTNVMARFTMRFAARVVADLAASDPEAYASLVRNTGVSEAEVRGWHRACDAMYVPFDESLGIHPQDASFLEREPWPFDKTPDDRYPLLLHYHPLVIYRHQVLKQADVVLAMYLRGARFTTDQKRRNFDYYDPITTGDSSLSACVQAIVAAQVGQDTLAQDYFQQALYLDLADAHGNTCDGVHVANAGGVWAGVVVGFAGMADDGEALSFAPRLPAGWASFRFRLRRRASILEVSVDSQGARVTVLSGEPVPVVVDDQVVHVEVGVTATIVSPQPG